MPLTLPIAGIDFETSGHSRFQKAQPMQIGLAVRYPSGTYSIIADSLLGGATHLTYHAKRTHGISLEACRGKPRTESFWPQVQKISQNMPLCAHNIPTERKILQEKFPWKPCRWIDTCTISRRLLPDCPNHTLETVTHHLGKTRALQSLFQKKSWHNALFDAVASLLIVEGILERFPEAQLDDLITHHI